MQFERSTAASGAERRSTVSNVSRKIRIMAALAAAGLASFAMQAQAENLLLKRADGSTMTTIPLLTSNGCTVVSGGDIEVRPQPTSGASNDGWCPAGVGVVPTVSVSVDDTTVVETNATNVTWQTSNAATCTGTATRNGTGTVLTGWNGTRGLQQAAPGLAVTFPEGSMGSWKLILTCTNNAGQTTAESQTVVVSDNGGGGDLDCVGVDPDFGLTRQTTMRNTDFLQGNDEHPNTTVDITAFSFIAGPWPARVQNGTIAVRSGSFVALEFNTGTVTNTNYGGTVSAPNRFGVIRTFPAALYTGNVLMTIAKCPGSFETAKLPQLNTTCRLQTGNSGFSWGVGVTDPFTCRLAENTKYYVNIAYVEYSTGLANCPGEPSSGSNPFTCHWFAEPR
jgi:hypothetical protein